MSSIHDPGQTERYQQKRDGEKVYSLFEYIEAFSFSVP